MRSELRGPALLAAAVNHIIQHPETWDQYYWHCGSTHCIAGHCEILGTGGQTPNPGPAVAAMIGISRRDANWLFDGSRTLVEIHRFAGELMDGYDRDGFSRSGYDRAGYDRAGHPLPLLPIPGDTQ